MRVLKFLILFFILLNFSGPVYAAADSVYDININVQTFQLENGMLFLVVERPATPQVAIRLAIRAGSALEETGKTGIAHLLEHMLFKGTKNFGSLDYKKDQELQDRIEAAYQVVLEEQSKRQPDTTVIEKKFAEMEALRREVQKIYVPKAFSAQLGKNGAVGVNAFTTKDQPVIAGTACDRVITSAPINRIGSFPAEDDVVATAAGQRFFTSASLDRIIPFTTED